ncbi:CapA family protein [Patescibacteria group bacterium]
MLKLLPKALFVLLAIFCFVLIFPSKLTNDQPFVNFNLKSLLQPKPQPVKLLFTGDLSYDRYIRQMGEENGFESILENLTLFLNDFDLVIANLESPITTNKSVSIYTQIGSPPNYIFTSPPITTKMLNQNNISVVNLGNNHILNQGQSGLNQTIDFLDKANIEYFGNINSLVSPSYLIKRVRGVKIGLVNYNQFSADSYNSAIKDIKTVKPQVDLLILNSHWGIEYTPIANQTIQNLAHQFIDAGVDLIIGVHPHVIQQTETYKQKQIYYSLGNFVFDQYFSQATQKGLLVEVNIDPKTLDLTFKDHYVSMNFPGGQTELVK